MAKLGTAWIDVDANLTPFHRKMATEMRGLGKGAQFKVKADVDRSSVRGVDRLSKSMGSARRGSEGLSNSMLRLKLVAAGLALGPAAQGLSALTAGAFAATASLGPLAGSLAALPNLVAAAAQGLGTFKLATSGIGDAVKAAMADQEAGASSAAKALDTSAAAAERVRSATRALDDAQRSASFAQEDVTKARADATRQVEEMRDAVAGAALEEQGAAISLRRAREELRKVERDPKASLLDVEEARLQVKVARAELSDVREQGHQAKRDLAKAEKQGVSNMPQVVEARRALAQANRGVTEASLQVAQAQKAMAQSGNEATASASKLSVEMAKLSPEAQAFVKHLISLRPALDRLRAAAGRRMLPGFSEAITDAQRNQPVLERLLERTGGAFANVARDAGRLVGSRSFGRDLGTLGQRNARWLEMMGKGAVDLFDALRHLMVAAGPFTDWLVRTGRGWAENARASALAGRRTGETARYLERTRAVMERLGSILQSVTAGWRAMARAAIPLGDDIWRSIDRGAQRFEDWAESARGQNSLRDWFANARATGRDFFGFLGDLMGRFRELRDSGRSVADSLTIVFGEGFARALSHAAEQAARHAPAVAESFVRGFFAANAWGRLLVGGWLLTKMGGLAALRGVGSRAGAAWSSGFVASSAAGTALAGGVGARGRGQGFGKAGPQSPMGGAIIHGQKGPQSPIVGRQVGTTMATTAAPAFRQRMGSSLKAMGPGLGLTLGLVFGPELAKTAAAAIRKQDYETGPRFKARSDFGRISREASSFEDLRKKIAGVNSENRRGVRYSDQMRVAVGQLEKQGRDAGQEFGRFRARIAPINDAFRRLRSGSVISLSAITGEVSENFNRISRVMGTRSAAGSDAVRKNFRLGARAIERSMKEGQFSSEKGMKAIRRLLANQSGAGKDAVAANFGEAYRVIRRTMRNSEGVTEKGMRAIRRLMVEELSALGFSRKRALNISKGDGKGGQYGDPDANKGREGGAFAQGGPVTFGRPGGRGRDQIPVDFGGRKIVVGSGEQGVVLNRHQQAELNARTADVGGLRGFFAKHDRPHYMATGGYVQGASPPSGAGAGPIRALAEQLFKRGFSVTSGGEYRGSGTYHDQQRALDFGDSVNSMSGLWKALFPKRGQTAELFGPSGLPGGGLYNSGTKFSDSGLQAMHEDHIHVALLSALSGALGKGGAAATAKLKRVLVKGPDSPLKSVVQGSLDAVHGAAQQRLSRIAERYGAGTGQALDIGAGGNYDGPLNRNFGQGSATTIGFNQAAMLAEKAGLPGVTYAQIAQGESALRPGAVSPDGGYGLWQMTPRVQSGATISAWESIGSYFNPWNNARMAKVLAGSGTGVSNYYGTGFMTDPNKHYTGPMRMARGGLAAMGEMFAPGGMVPFPGGRMPSRDQVTGQKRETEQARDRLQKLRQQEDPRKKKALEKLEKARAAAKKNYGGERKKLKSMRQRRKAGKGRQGRRQTRLSGLLAGMGLPEQMIGSLDTRAVTLEDAEATYGQVEGSYRADERVTPETLRSLLGPGMGGLTADDQKDLIGSTQSILTPPELNDLLGRQQSLLTGYQNQQGLAARIRDTIQERIPKVEGLLTNLRDRAKANMKELQRRLKEAKRLRKEMADKRKRLRNITADVREIRRKKKPTDADRKRRIRLGKEAEAIRGRIPNIANRLTEIGARVPVLEGDLSFLTGQKRPRTFSGENVEGLIGEGQGILDTGIGDKPSLRDSLATHVEMLRPGGIPSQIHEQGLSIGALKLEGAWSPERSDPAGPADVSEDESAGLLRELLKQANQRTAVSERGFDVLRNFPAFAGTFHTGGIVPGPASRESIALVRGQETFRTEKQEAALSSPSEVRVVLEDKRTTVLQDDRVIRSIVHDETRKQSRGAIRGLPSGGGGRY